MPSCANRNANSADISSMALEVVEVARLPLHVREGCPLPRGFSRDTRRNVAATHTPTLRVEAHICAPLPMTPLPSEEGTGPVGEQNCRADERQRIRTADFQQKSRERTTSDQGQTGAGNQRDSHLQSCLFNHEPKHLFRSRTQRPADAYLVRSAGERSCGTSSSLKVFAVQQNRSASGTGAFVSPAPWVWSPSASP